MLDTANEKIENMVAAYDDHLSRCSREEHEDYQSVTNISFSEHFSLQGLQSRLHARGLIDTDAALWFYRTLGETLSVFEQQPLSKKLLCISLLMELSKRSGIKP